MRFPVVAASFVLLVAPSAAEAGSVAREGTELVFRANPGDTDVLTVAQASGSVTFMAGRGATISAGPGCEIANLGVRCDAADATVVRVLLEDGDDRLDINGRVPVVADLGPGDDEGYT